MQVVLAFWPSGSVCDTVCECTELWPGGSLVSGVLCKRWPMSWPCISVCLALVYSIAFAAVMWPRESRADFVQRYSGIVHALSSHVLAACSLLC